MCLKRVDGTRFNNRLVSDLKKDLNSKFLSWMASLVNKDEKGGKMMQKFCRKVEAVLSRQLDSAGKTKVQSLDWLVNLLFIFARLPLSHSLMT